MLELLLAGIVIGAIYAIGWYVVAYGADSFKFWRSRGSWESWLAIARRWRK